MMKIVNRLKNIFKNQNRNDSLSLEKLETWYKNNFFDTIKENPELTSDIAEIVYFICLKHLTETISKIPWDKIKITEKKGKEKIFDTKLDNLLNIRPNPYMSAANFWQSIELSRLHYGNAYIYIETDKTGEVKNLWQLPSQEIEIYVDDKGYFKKENSIFYVWKDIKHNKEWKFDNLEIIHLKTHISFNGITGLPVRNILKNQLNIQKNATSFLRKLYSQNMFGSKILLHYIGEMNDKTVKNMVEKLEKYSSETRSGKIIPLPIGFQAQLIDMKLSDAQFFENNKYTALQIAAAFGIKPNIINDYSKSSYSNSETQQLDFYINTLQPLFNAYEQEISYKLSSEEELNNGIRYKLNEKILFKMDSKTQAEVYTKLVGNFIMTPNEAREEIGLPYIEGGDKLIGNGNYIDLEKVGTQYLKRKKGVTENEV